MASKHRQAIYLLLWFVVTCALALLLIRLDIMATEVRFQDNAHSLYTASEQRVKINEAVLEGFAALLSVLAEPDFQRMRRYAREVLTDYRHIHRLAVLVRVTRDDLETAERGMRASGYPEFRIKPIGDDGDRRTIAEKSHYFPIMFIEPITPESEKLLGMDIESVPRLRPALLESLVKDGAVASMPLELTAGHRAYVMFRAVAMGQDRPTSSAEGAPVTAVAALLILTEPLFSDVSPLLTGVNCILYQDGLERIVLKRSQAPPAGRLEQMLLPRFRFEKRLASVSQPFLLVVEKQMGWANLRWGLLLLMVGIAGAAGLLFAHALQSRRRSEATTRKACDDLRLERRQLDGRVQARTAELSALNERLEVEVVERKKIETALRQRIAENRRLTSQLIRIQETERRVLARELHDEMGQCLTAIKTDAVLINQCAEACPEELAAAGCSRRIAESANEISTVAGRVYDIVKSMMRRMRPSALDELGLEAALESCIGAARLEDINVFCHKQFSGDFDDLGESINITLYRVLQETLTNIAKYADAGNVWVELYRVRPVSDGEPERVGIRVRDDGRGMDIDNTPWDFGLMGLRERVQALDGRFEVTSRPGAGTSVQAVIPIPRREAAGEG